MTYWTHRINLQFFTLTTCRMSSMFDPFLVSVTVFTITIKTTQGSTELKQKLVNYSLMCQIGPIVSFVWPMSLFTFSMSLKKTKQTQKPQRLWGRYIYYLALKENDIMNPCTFIYLIHHYNRTKMFPKHRRPIITICVKEGRNCD